MNHDDGNLVKDIKKSDIILLKLVGPVKHQPRFI